MLLTNGVTTKILMGIIAKWWKWNNTIDFCHWSFGVLYDTLTPRSELESIYIYITADKLQGVSEWE